MLHTPVYVKLDANVLYYACCLKGSAANWGLSSNPDVVLVLLGKNKKETEKVQFEEVVVPIVRVQLLHSVKILSQQSVTVTG